MGPLNHSPADVLRHLLIDLYCGTDPDVAAEEWPIYVSSEPSSPDQAITLYDTSPIQDGRSMRTGEYVERPGIQIKIRGVNHDDTFAKANQIKNVCDTTIYRNTVTISDLSGTGTSDYLVYSVHRTSGPLSLGKEQGTNRLLFTINVLITLRQD